MSLIACGSTMYLSRLSMVCFRDDSRERQEIFMCLAGLLIYCVSNFCRFVNGGAEISIKSFFNEIISVDLTVCHKQIEEKWRQQIIAVAEHEFSNIEGIFTFTSNV